MNNTTNTPPLTPMQAAVLDYIRGNPGTCRYAISCDPGSGVIVAPGSMGAKKAVWRITARLHELGLITMTPGPGGRVALTAR